VACSSLEPIETVAQLQRVAELEAGALLLVPSAQGKEEREGEDQQVGSSISIILSFESKPTHCIPNVCSLDGNNKNEKKKRPKINT
jgi:hypothetical protein